MASIKPYGDGEWRAQVARRGVRDSKTFTSKGAAVAWAGTREAEIMAGARGEIPNLTVKALLERYELEVSSGKKGRRWESIRLQALQRDPLAAVRLRQLDTPHVAEWQKRRLTAVSGASARRERNLLSHVFSVAVEEWKWLHKNPFGTRGKGVRRPKDSKPRNRIASPAEQAKLLLRASPTMKRVITIALETCMRAGEIASNPPIKGRVAYLGDSKNGEGRDVPLSAKALEAWAEPLDITAASISALFARLCEGCEIHDLTFHDLKHTGMTRLSKKLDPWELAKMTGNKDMNLLLRVYYKQDAEETAKKLA